MSSEIENKKSNEKKLRHRFSSWWHHYPAIERFTLSVAVFTAFLAVFTAFLGVVGFLQWCTLEKTVDTSRIRDRANVYFSTPVFEKYPPTGEAKEYIFKILMANSGAIPARKLHVRYGVIVAPTSNIDFEPFDRVKWINVNVPMTLGPKQPFLFQLFKIETKLAEFEEMKKGKVVKFIVTEVTYNDDFSSERRQRITQMNVRLNVDGNGDHSFSYLASHNCTDDDCQVREGVATSQTPSPGPFPSDQESPSMRSLRMASVSSSRLPQSAAPKTR
ncbi:MAG TPA: hypothetical protein PLT63_01070 [Syntrophales bacterium]|nr:hypothetical protein [Syntrophales bacterium]HPL68122.1 hypothetical protein [Smithellaceae bacterium]